MCDGLSAYIPLFLAQHRNAWTHNKRSVVLKHFAVVFNYVANYMRVSHHEQMRQVTKKNAG